MYVVSDAHPIINSRSVYVRSCPGCQNARLNGSRLATHFVARSGSIFTRMGRIPRADVRGAIVGHSLRCQSPIFLYYRGSLKYVPHLIAFRSKIGARRQLWLFRLADTGGTTHPSSTPARPSGENR